MPSKSGRIFWKFCFCMRDFSASHTCRSWEDTDLTFLSITFNATFHPTASAQTRGTHLLNIAALLAGVGHLNNPQSRLSSKFWPRPRQSAGFAWISPRRRNDPSGAKVTYTAWEEKCCLPLRLPVHRGVWFFAQSQLNQQRYQTANSFASGTQAFVAWASNTWDKPLTPALRRLSLTQMPEQ